MIIDLQRRIAEVGRIRIGKQVPTAGRGSRPAKLDTFRLTSADKTRITHAARLYGGTPSEWAAPSGRQWEVITDSDTLPVLVPPADLAFTQHYELWSAGGCQRRCDGVTETITDSACVCDPTARECDIHTRLSVLLRDIPGLGVWRLDTQGYYAAVELQGAVQIIQSAVGRGQMLPAALRLEQRMTKRPGQGTHRFAVPVLDIEVSPAQLLSGGAGVSEWAERAIEAPQKSTLIECDHEPHQIVMHDSVEAARESQRNLTPVPESVPEWPSASVAEQVAVEKPVRKSRQQSIPSTGVQPRTREQVAAQQAAESAVDAKSAFTFDDVAAAVADVAAGVAVARGSMYEPDPQDIEDLEREMIDNPNQIALDVAPPSETVDARPPTRAMVNKLFALTGEVMNFDDTDDGRAARLKWCSAAIGRDITSSRELTRTESGYLIDLLETSKAKQHG